MNQLAQGLGTYIKKDGDKLKFYDGGLEQLVVDIDDSVDVYAATRAFCEYCSVNHYRAKQQLQSLVTSYIV